jgi:DNA-binding NtrC family response regulator
MEKKTLILLIDPDAESYYRNLAAAIRNCRLTIEQNKHKACEFFFRNDVNLVLLDHTPDDPCTDLLQVLKFVAPSVPIIITTVHGSEELAVYMFRIGAHDYLKKPLRINELKQRVETALGKDDFSARIIFLQASKG